MVVVVVVVVVFGYLGGCFCFGANTWQFTSLIFESFFHRGRFLVLFQTGI